MKRFNEMMLVRVNLYGGLNLQVIRAPKGDILSVKEILVKNVGNDTEAINSETLRDELEKSLRNINRVNSYNGFDLARGQNTVEIAFVDNLSSLVKNIYSYIEDYIYDIKMAGKCDLPTYIKGELERIEKRLNSEGLEDIYKKIYKKIRPLLEFEGIIPIIECDSEVCCELLDTDDNTESCLEELNFSAMFRDSDFAY